MGRPCFKKPEKGGEREREREEREREREYKDRHEHWEFTSMCLCMAMSHGLSTGVTSNLSATDLCQY
jgi:hypothetical protein